MKERQQTAGGTLIRLGLVALLGAVAFAAGAEQPAATSPASPALSPASPALSPASAPAQSAERAPETTPAEDRARALFNGLRFGGGLQAHIDPETGVLMVPPLKVRRQLSARMLDLVSTSHHGLEVVELPNGLTYVDVMGRFQSLTTATVGEDGEVRIHHGLPAPPEPAVEDAGTTQNAGEDQP